MVEWLISKEKARNRPEALMLATGLMNEGFLQPAGDLSKEGAEGGEQSAFLDQTDALYYFVSKLSIKKKIFISSANHVFLSKFLKSYSLYSLSARQISANM